MEAIKVVESAGTSWREETHNYWWLWMFCFQDFTHEIVLSNNNGISEGQSLKTRTGHSAPMPSSTVSSQPDISRMIT